MNWQHNKVTNLRVTFYKLGQVRIQHIMDLPETLSKLNPTRKTKIWQISAPLLIRFSNFDHFKYQLLCKNIQKMTFC